MVCRYDGLGIRNVSVPGTERPRDSHRNSKRFLVADYWYTYVLNTLTHRETEGDSDGTGTRSGETRVYE